MDLQLSHANMGLKLSITHYKSTEGHVFHQKEKVMRSLSLLGNEHYFFHIGWNL